MSKLHVRKGDNVKILTGKDKGRTGKITMVNPDNGRVVVEGSNIIIKHVKAKSAQAQSRIEKVAGSIDSSNVQIICPECKKATRVAKKEVEVKGVKRMQRTCKKCQSSLDIRVAAKADKKAKKAKKDDKETAEAEVAAEEKKAAATPAKKGKGKDKPEKASGDGITSKNEDGAVV